METAWWIQWSWGMGILVFVLLITEGFGKLLGDPSARQRGANRATPIAAGGRVLAGFVIATSILRGFVHGQSFTDDLLWALSSGALGAFLLVLVGHFGMLLLLRREIFAAALEGNTAAAVAVAAHYVATGILLSSALHGVDTDTLVPALSFALVGQASLYLLIIVFRTITTYADQVEIRKGNNAAAISYAGITVAFGLIVGHATDGEFQGYAESFAAFAVALLGGLLFWPIRQILVEVVLLGGRLCLRGGRVDLAVGDDGDVGVASLEACTYVGAALLVRTIG